MEEPKAQITDKFNAPKNTKLKTTDILNGDNNGNKCDFIEKQIREIDRELNKFDISGSNLRGAVANQKEVHMDTPFLDTYFNLPVAAETVLEADASHVDNLSSQTFETKKGSHSILKEWQMAVACKGGFLTRTWTWVARIVQGLMIVVQVKWFPPLNEL